MELLFQCLEPTDAAREVVAAREELALCRQLVRQGKSERRDRGSIIKARWRIVAILVALSSGSTDLAEMYVCNCLLRSQDRTPAAHSLRVDGALLQTWLADPRVARAVRDACLDTGSQDHFLAMKFLVESLVVDFIARQNSKGQLVPFHVMFGVYLRLWQLLGTQGAASLHVQQLVFGGSWRKKEWSRAFRETWPMDWGHKSASPPLEDQSIVRRVPGARHGWGCLPT